MSDFKSEHTTQVLSYNISDGTLNTPKLGDLDINIWQDDTNLYLKINPNDFYKTLIGKQLTIILETRKLEYVVNRNGSGTHHRTRKKYRCNNSGDSHEAPHGLEPLIFKVSASNSGANLTIPITDIIDRDATDFYGLIALAYSKIVYDGIYQEWNHNVYKHIRYRIKLPNDTGDYITPEYKLDTKKTVVEYGEYLGL